MSELRVSLGGRCYLCQRTGALGHCSRCGARYHLRDCSLLHDDWCAHVYRVYRLPGDPHD